MVTTNRNCCWHGQPDPAAWKKPTVEGCVGWARKPRYDDMRTCERVTQEILDKLDKAEDAHGVMLPRSIATSAAEMEALADGLLQLVLPPASAEAWQSDYVCVPCLKKGLGQLDDRTFFTEVADTLRQLRRCE